MDIRTTTKPTVDAAPQDPGERARSHRTANWVAVWVLTALVAAGYNLFSLGQYYTFRTSADDLLIFDEAIRSYSHFKPGISLFFGFHENFGPNFSLLGDHWSPILIVLAPLYWVFNSPETLLVVQAVLFALAIPPLWVFTRRAFGGDGKATAAAYLVSVAYAVSWPLASALAFQFHEVAFAPVLMAVALERIQAGRLRSALIALAILLLVKEDMGLFVAGIGVYLAVSGPRVNRQRLVAVVLILGGIAYTWIATDILIPAFGGRANWYWSYPALGNNVPQAAWHVITHPFSSFELLFTPSVKLDTMLWLFGAFCFLPLLSPISLATIPLLAERMLANTASNWWVTSFHYNAYLVIVLACAAVDGAARLDRWVAWVRQRLADNRAQRATTTAPVAATGVATGTGTATAATAATTTVADSAPGLAPADTVTARAAGDGASGDHTASDHTTDQAAADHTAAQDRAVADGSPTPVGAMADGAGEPTTPAGPAGATAPEAQAPAARTARRTPRFWTPLPRGNGVVALFCAAAICVVGLYTVPKFSFGPALHPSFYHRTANMRAAAEADAMVPSGVDVEAVPLLGSQLSPRDTVALWDGDGGTPAMWAPWVVADVWVKQFSWHTVHDQKERVTFLKQHGYQVVFKRGGYVVLHRVGSK
jgi:uncharacterized membrane protein